MGADIHLHLEYHTTPPGQLRREQARRTHPLWPRPVIANRFYIPRDYALFAALAGVRNREGRPVKIAPCGLPEDVAREIFHQYYVEIFSADVSVEWLQAGWKWCRPEDAEGRVRLYGAAIEDRGARRYIAGPDLHTPSYLYLAEVREALRHPGYDQAQLSTEFHLVLGGMKFIDRQFGDRCSRIVFWFDC